MRELVLIETYWNVNLIEDAEAAAVNYVLIETYWNVNFFPLDTESVTTRINRNILECKFM